MKNRSDLSFFVVVVVLFLKIILYFRFWGAPGKSQPRTENVLKTNDFLISILSVETCKRMVVTITGGNHHQPSLRLDTGQF